MRTLVLIDLLLSFFSLAAHQSLFLLVCGTGGNEKNEEVTVDDAIVTELDGRLAYQPRAQGGRWFGVDMTTGEERSR